MEHKMMTERRWKRLYSFLIDAAVLFIFFLVSEQLFGKPQLLATQRALEALQGMGGTQAEFEAAFSAFYAQFEAAYLLCLLIWGVYEAGFTILTGGRTIGKLLMGIRLVAVKRRENYFLTVLKLLLRAAVKPLLLMLFRGFPFIISIIMVFADRTDRTGYDRMCGLGVELVKKKTETEAVHD